MLDKIKSFFVYIGIFTAGITAALMAVFVLKDSGNENSSDNKLSENDVNINKNEKETEVINPTRDFMETISDINETIKGKK